MVLFVIAGFATYDGTTVASDVAASPKGLIMLVVPALLIFMMIKGTHMLVALSASVAVGLVVGVISGLLPVSDILIIDMNSFSVGGTLVDGINGMMDTVVFAMLLMSLVHLLEVGGLFEAFLQCHREEHPHALPLLHSLHHRSRWQDRFLLCRQ